MIDLILFLACAVSVTIWLMALLMPVRWRMSEQWEPVNSPQAFISKWPELSVIVPARNERHSLPLTLPSWLNQDYPLSEIFLIDDESSDGTAAYAETIAAQSNHTIRILKGTTPPSGWTGKLWALEQGVRASRCDWLLFTDADILHKPGLWRGLVAKALTEQQSMVSLMAILDTRGVWARLLIPAFIYFFHVLYPFGKVKDTQSKTTAAAGGCILISRHALSKIGGLEGHRNAWIDDLALARRIKCAGLPLSLSLTKSAVSIRPYHYLSDLWNMVARSAFSQLRYSWFALFGTVVGLTVLFLSPIIGICASAVRASSLHTTALSFLALCLMFITYIPTLRFFGMSMCRAFTLPIAGSFYIAMTVSSAINHLTGRREWRGARR